MANNTVDSGTSIIEVIIGQDNQDGILSFLSPNKNCVTTEELELLHGVVGEGNDRVIIVSGVGDPVRQCESVKIISQWQIIRASRKDIHELVGLLLLLEDGGRDIIILHRVVSFGSLYVTGAYLEDLRLWALRQKRH